MAHYNEKHGHSFKESTKYFHSTREFDSFIGKELKTSYETLAIANSCTKGGFHFKYYKCNYVCNGVRAFPSFLNSKSNSNNNISVKFNFDHVHRSDWTRISVPPFFNNILINQLLKNISIENIYTDILDRLMKKMFAEKH
eukprot:GAHX01002804.1.p1 GENE.GAHX01002804.1~~GAHX01002804.1.p1  ORF type:complete len:140 (-),score=20.12 GAHX01002804.1:629-1048(-)